MAVAFLLNRDQQLDAFVAVAFEVDGEGAFWSAGHVKVADHATKIASCSRVHQARC